MIGGVHLDQVLKQAGADVLQHALGGSGFNERTDDPPSSLRLFFNQPRCLPPRPRVTLRPFCALRCGHPHSAEARKIERQAPSNLRPCGSWSSSGRIRLRRSVNFFGELTAPNEFHQRGKGYRTHQPNTATELRNVIPSSHDSASPQPIDVIPLRVGRLELFAPTRYGFQQGSPAFATSGSSGTRRANRSRARFLSAARIRSAPVVSYSTARNTNTPLCPPNPNAFDITVRTGARRATLGT